MKTGSKSFCFSGFKVSQDAPTPEQLAKINKLTRRPFSADELYIGQIRLAHNAIDRDNERFSEQTMEGFAATAIRKTLLMDHGKYESATNAIGKFFDVEMEKLSPAQATAETGEEFQLPADVKEVWFLSPWFYIPRAGVDKQQLVKIDAGVFDFASIGFRVEACVPVADDMGNTLYYEYRGRGEMTEGSLVYLGAQQGASVKEWKEAQNKEGGSTVKNLVAKLFKSTGRLFSEDMNEFIDELKAIVGTPDAELAAEKTKLAKLEARAAELAPFAAIGKAWRDELVTSYVTCKAKLGECAETPEAQKVVKDLAAAYPIQFLKSEVEQLQARVAEGGGKKTWVDNPLIPEGNVQQDKTAQGGGTKTDNPLVPKENLSQAA